MIDAYRAGQRDRQADEDRRSEAQYAAQQEALARQQQEAFALQQQALVARQRQEADARGLADKQSKYTRQQIGGWQYTEWGMSPRQAAIASNGEVPESSGNAGQSKNGLSVGNVGSYTAGNRHFAATFYYSESGLSDVTLKPGYPSNCQKLREDLSGVYGEPIKTDLASIIFYEWKDDAKNNFVQFSEIGRECSIMYRPIKAVALGL